MSFLKIVLSANIVSFRLHMDSLVICVARLIRRLSQDQHSSAEAMSYGAILSIVSIPAHIRGGRCPAVFLSHVSTPEGKWTGGRKTTVPLALH